MKKFLALILSLVMALSLAACGGGDTSSEESEQDTGSETTASDVKVGFIFLHDENSTYDLNFINGAKEAAEALGVEYVIKTNVDVYKRQAWYNLRADMKNKPAPLLNPGKIGRAHV